MDVSDAKGAGTRGELRAALAAAAPRLPAAERRVAEVVAREPETVAFGTVAQVAARAGTSGPSVVRLAARLGFAGFVGLQAAVRRDLRRRLRPAVERVRAPEAGRRDVLPRVLAVELANVRVSLEGIDARVFAAAVGRLAEPRRRITVLPSEQCRGVGLGFAGELALVRDGVQLAGGSPFRVATQLAALRRVDTVVLMDVQRHERWLVEAAEQVRASGAAHLALVDSELSPLAEGALAVLTVGAAGAGPFDSQVGMMAVANALLAGVAARLRGQVTRRVDALERIWVERGALLDDRAGPR
jgi:DNA-binding MurR/RpiR family transcriptional regulator